MLVDLFGQIFKESSLIQTSLYRDSVVKRKMSEGMRGQTFSGHGVPPVTAPVSVISTNHYTSRIGLPDLLLD
jgi:hypothetical protein